MNLIGHSLGGTLPRFALRFWPDLRPLVNHLIGFGPTNHGTEVANVACSVSRCPIGVRQQRVNSSFLCALNSYQETFPSIRYTNILSRFDEIVRPVQSSELHGEQVRNIYIQDLCPRRLYVEHLALGLYDYCSYRLTRSRSAATTNCCSKVLMPGIDGSLVEIVSRIVYSSEEHLRRMFNDFGASREEAQLRCEFRRDCPEETKNESSFVQSS